MKFFGKTLGLMLAGLALAGCGGGGGDGGTFIPQSGTITLAPGTTTLPTNTGNYQATDAGPNQTEVTVTMRNADGTLMVGKDVQLSISPVSIAAMSFLISSDNPDGNTLWGAFTIKGTNGVATFWVNGGAIAGDSVLTASTIDANTSRSISTSVTFHVVTGVGNNPASVELVPTPPGVYLPSSGGNNTSQIRAVVRDSGNQFVPNPGAFDNIQYEIVGDSGSATLTVAGKPSGRVVTTQTANGQATASFQSTDDTPQGPIQIKATVDRADNNVSNGIQDPVTFTTSVIVSDGKLDSLVLTSPLFAPSLPGITINTVSGTVDASQVGSIPADPDATLSLVVSAEANDRQGNPVIPGTPLHFGLVDWPVGAPGSADDNQFLISGYDGNPQEGGSSFTAPTGHFTTAGGGAGPGDALIVFGQAVQGNVDLESAVTVQRINSATSATVLPVFNQNNTTGQSVDSGPVLPYLFGRARFGNITAASTTNADGVAHASLTYTVNTVGNAVAVWVQGDGVDRVSNAPRRITDAGTMAYPGVAPASIVAFPNPLIGDATTSVTVCVADALGIPLRGVQIGFAFNLPAGTGSIDGSAGGGVMDDLTGLDGCTTGTVVTSGLPVTAPGGDSGSVVFTGAGATSDPVTFVVSIASLQANPNAIPVNCQGTYTATVAVRALSAGGTPLAGATINAVCSGTGLAVTPASGTTNASGTATFSITATDFADPPLTGDCTFSSADGQSVSVRVFGSATSPAPVCN
jgi:hypothetical protein